MTATVDRHVCAPPVGQAVGSVWLCPDCWCTYRYRPVQVRELGRVLNLWVLRHRPINYALGKKRQA